MAALSQSRARKIEYTLKTKLYISLNLFLLIASLTHAQYKIGVVDVEAVLEASISYTYLKEEQDQLKDSLTSIGEDWLDSFKEKAQMVVKRVNGCMSLKEHEYWMNKLQKEEAILMEFDSLLNEVLIDRVEELRGDLRTLIMEKAFEDGKEHDFHLVVDQSSILYSKEGLDRSKEVLASIQSDDEFHAIWKTMVNKKFKQYLLEVALLKERKHYLEVMKGVDILEILDSTQIE